MFLKRAIRLIPLAVQASYLNAYKCCCWWYGTKADPSEQVIQTGQPTVQPVIDVAREVFDESGNPRGEVFVYEPTEESTLKADVNNFINHIEPSHFKGLPDKANVRTTPGIYLSFVQEIELWCLFRVKPGENVELIDVDGNRVDSLLRSHLSIWADYVRSRGFSIDSTGRFAIPLDDESLNLLQQHHVPEDFSVSIFDKTENLNHDYTLALITQQYLEACKLHGGAIHVGFGALRFFEKHDCLLVLFWKDAARAMKALGLNFINQNDKLHLTLCGHVFQDMSKYWECDINSIEELKKIQPYESDDHIQWMRFFCTKDSGSFNIIQTASGQVFSDLDKSCSTIGYSPIKFDVTLDDNRRKKIVWSRADLSFRNPLDRIYVPPTEDYKQEILDDISGEAVFFRYNGNTAEFKALFNNWINGDPGMFDNITDKSQIPQTPGTYLVARSDKELGLFYLIKVGEGNSFELIDADGQTTNTILESHKSILHDYLESHHLSLNPEGRVFWPVLDESIAQLETHNVPAEFMIQFLQTKDRLDDQYTRSIILKDGFPCKLGHRKICSSFGVYQRMARHQGKNVILFWQDQAGNQKGLLCVFNYESGRLRLTQSVELKDLSSEWTCEVYTRDLEGIPDYSSGSSSFYTVDYNGSKEYCFEYEGKEFFIIKSDWKVFSNIDRSFTFYYDQKAIRFEFTKADGRNSKKIKLRIMEPAEVVKYKKLQEIVTSRGIAKVDIYGNTFFNIPYETSVSNKETFNDIIEKISGCIQRSLPETEEDIPAFEDPNGFKYFVFFVTEDYIEFKPVFGHETGNGNFEFIVREGKVETLDNAISHSDKLVEMLDEANKSKLGEIQTYLRSLQKRLNEIRS